MPRGPRSFSGRCQDLVLIRDCNSCLSTAFPLIDQGDSSSSHLCRHNRLAAVTSNAARASSHPSSPCRSISSHAPTAQRQGASVGAARCYTLGPVAEIERSSTAISGESGDSDAGFGSPSFVEAICSYTTTHTKPSNFASAAP